MKNLWRYLILLLVFAGTVLFIIFIVFNEKNQVQYERIEITLTIVTFLSIFAINILKKNAA